MDNLLDTRQAAAYCGMAFNTFKWWVWNQPDEARQFTPDGWWGGKPYWTRATLDEYMATRYRKPGRPGKEE